MQLTPEQEQRIQAVVSAGAEEAFDAAVSAVQAAAAPGFEGNADGA